MNCIVLARTLLLEPEWRDDIFSKERGGHFEHKITAIKSSGQSVLQQETLQLDELIFLARTVNTLIRTRVKRWHFLQGARRALWTQITAIKSSGMDTNWDSTLQKLGIPPFLWKPGMGKQRSTGQAPSSPAFKIGPEGYVFYIVLHLDVACPKFWFFKNLNLEVPLLSWKQCALIWRGTQVADTRQRPQIYCC